MSAEVVIHFTLAGADDDAVGLLRRLADRIEQSGMPVPDDELLLQDINGNTVGALGVTALACPRCGGPTDPQWFCSEGYCPACCTETDEGAES